MAGETRATCSLRSSSSVRNERCGPEAEGELGGLCDGQITLDARHDRRGQTVAEEVDRGAGHVHDFVDARRMATPSSGRPKLTSVPERMTSDARGTPATPLEVSMSVSIMTSCWPVLSSTPAAWATKMDATAR